jgi:hypothetical protein
MRIMMDAGHPSFSLWKSKSNSCWISSVVWGGGIDDLACVDGSVAAAVTIEEVDDMFGNGTTPWSIYQNDE